MNMKMVSVNLPEKIVDIVESDLTGVIGSGKSDVIRTILIIYLSENGYLDGIELSDDD
ncbi:MAG: hypothetical protein ACOCSL_04990 [Thermoplasmatota archaeon]